MFPVPFQVAIVRPNQFEHQSDIHGAGHVNRVIWHALYLCAIHNRQDLMLPVWAAAYLHDLNRQHDGLCYQHGAWAVEKSLPRLAPFFAQWGVTAEDLGRVAVAVIAHSRPEEVQGKDEREDLIIKLLKDADGLDRVRLGDLDPRYFRLPHTAACVEIAQRLYDETFFMSNGLLILSKASRIVSEFQQETQKVLVRQKPCGQCPFSKNTKKTYLDTMGQNGERFAGQAEGPFMLPCHMETGFSEWKKNFVAGRDAVPQCFGAATYRANIGVGDKLPNGIACLPPDHGAVIFANAEELLAHHEGITIEEARAKIARKPVAQMTKEEMEKSTVVTRPMPK